MININQMYISKKRSEISTKNTMAVKKVAAKKLKMAMLKKKWNQKWAANGSAVIVLMEIKF